jgi:stress-induced morphogen
MATYTLKVLNNTVLKQQPIPSSQITDPNQKQSLPAGTEIPIHSYRYDAGTDHYKIAFLSTSFKGKNTWFVRKDKDIQILKDGSPIPPLQPVKLNVHWHSQLDNSYEPDATCNVTSVAMCLEYFGIKSQDPNQQLEDELFLYCQDKDYDKHSPEDLARLVRDYGGQDDFQYKAKWQDVKNWLSKGYPAIVHGYFTGSGHIIAIIGFNAQGWIVNDPYGEWFESGYDTQASGAALTYSYAMMDRLCGPNSTPPGELWIHYIWK